MLLHMIAERTGLEPALRTNVEQLSKLRQYHYAYLSKSPVKNLHVITSRGHEDDFAEGRVIETRTLPYPKLSKLICHLDGTFHLRRKRDSNPHDFNINSFSRRGPLPRIFRLISPLLHT